MAHEGSPILNRNAGVGTMTPEFARERSTELAQGVKEARAQATRHVSEATALLDEALERADASRRLPRRQALRRTRRARSPRPRLGWFVHPLTLSTFRVQKTKRDKGPPMATEREMRTMGLRIFEE